MPQASETVAEAVDLIGVTATENFKVASEGAKVWVQIKGSSFVSTNAASTKAREVAGLVSQLQTVGVDAEDIEVDNVRVDVNAGLIKTSEATYTLVVHCRRNELMPAVITAISNQRQATLARVEWQYPDAEAAYLRSLEAALAKAKGKAEVAAKALGVRIVAVHRFAEGNFEDANDFVFFHEQATAMVPRSRAKRLNATVDFGMTMSRSKEMEVSVNISFRTEPLES
jgi:uncharacterized protein YggE